MSKKRPASSRMRLMKGGKERLAFSQDRRVSRRISGKIEVEQIFVPRFGAPGREGKGTLQPS